LRCPAIDNINRLIMHRTVLSTFCFSAGSIATARTAAHPPRSAQVWLASYREIGYGHV
jgi:hypothetical protein